MAKVKSPPGGAEIPGLVFSRRTIKKAGGDVYNKNVRMLPKKYKSKSEKKERRPAIPPVTQLRLWTMAGGRCEFPGCNELLLRDDLTLTPGNYANIAHIIAYSPKGPRGDEILSKKLEKDISNLMLMCLRHSRMIDSKENLSVYTVDFLKKCKYDHEQRVNLQTGIAESKKSTVVRIQSNIRGRRVEVPYNDTCVSLMCAGRYPVDEKGVLVDITNIDYSLEKSFWDTAAGQIDSTIKKAFTVGNDGKKISHISIFGIAPIPLLAYLGFKLGNTVNADIYIKTREKPWSLTLSKPNLKFLTEGNNTEVKSDNAVLVIGISGGGASAEEVNKHIGSDVPVYVIRAVEPGLDSIQCVEDIEAFRIVYRKAITEITERHGKKCKIHLFAAIPTCAAIVCGREVLHGVDPQILVYEHVDGQDGYIPAIIIN
jgi:hypothetical protein